MMDQIQKEIDSIIIGYEQALKMDGQILYITKDSNKRYILSKYNPVNEAERLISDQEANNETLWIVLGFYLGYVAEAIIKRIGREANILVIEPNPWVLKEQLETTHDKNWNQYKNLVFFSGTDFQELKEKYVSKSGFERYNNTNIICTREYQEHYIQYYSKVVQMIGEIKVDAIMNLNTIELINTITMSNIVQNRKHIIDAYDLTYHKERYKGIPAIIVSSGPSLDKNIHLLKEFKGLIFAVGRSLTAILNQGIQPDFVLTLDPQDIIYSTFMGNTTTNVPMIASANANTRLLEDGRGPKYIIDNEKDLVHALTGMEVPFLPTGGSVATLCLVVANYMGCNPIIFIGQDLAFTDMKKYSLGSSTDNDQGTNNSVVNRVDNLKQIKSYNGGLVYSDYSLITFKNWIEDFIRVFNDRMYINATEGGAYIEGAVHEPLSQVIEKYKDIVKPKLKHHKNSMEGNSVDNHIKQCISDLKRLTEYATQGERLASKLLDEYVIHKGVRQHKIDNLLVRLEKIDNSIEKLDKRYLANRLFAEIYNRHLMMNKYHEIPDESKVDKGIRISTFSYDIYKRIRGKSVEWVECINEAMEE